MLGGIPHYAGLEWRLDAVAASRSLPTLEQSNISPIITMKLKLHFPPLSQVSDNHPSNDKMCTNVQELILQTDPVNLFHITDVLEKAMREGSSQQLRKLQRQL